MWRERNKEEGGGGEKVGKCVYNVRRVNEEEERWGIGQCGKRETKKREEEEIIGKCVYNVWREKCQHKEKRSRKGRKKIPYLEATFGGVGNA